MKIKDPVNYFLEEVYGYAKVRAILEGKKPETVSVHDFLDGTIMKNFKKSAIVDIGETGLGRKLIGLPGISNILTTEEVLKEPQFAHAKMVNGDLSYHIGNRAFFHNMDLIQVGDFLQRKVAPYFPKSKLLIERGEMAVSTWEASVIADNFGLYVEGSSPNNTKGLIIDFNTSEENVERLRALTRKFYGFRSQVGVDRVEPLLPAN